MEKQALTRDEIVHGYHQLGEALTDEQIEAWLRREELSPGHAPYFWRYVNYNISQKLKRHGSAKIAARRRQENGRNGQH